MSAVLSKPEAWEVQASEGSCWNYINSQHEDYPLKIALFLNSMLSTKVLKTSAA